MSLVRTQADPPTHMEEIDFTDEYLYSSLFYKLLKLGIDPPVALKAARTYFMHEVANISNIPD